MWAIYFFLFVSLFIVYLLVNLLIFFLLLSRFIFLSPCKPFNFFLLASLFIVYLLVNLLIFFLLASHLFFSPCEPFYCLSPCKPFLSFFSVWAAIYTVYPLSYYHHIQYISSNSADKKTIQHKKVQKLKRKKSLENTEKIGERYKKQGNSRKYRNNVDNAMQSTSRKHKGFKIQTKKRKHTW